MTENKRIKPNNKLRKRFLSMMLALAMVLAMLPASAFADGGNTDRIEELMTEISAAYTNDSSEWVIMDMAAYGKVKPDAVSKTSADARQEYINAVVKSLENPGWSAVQTYSKNEIGLKAIGGNSKQIYKSGSSAPVDNSALLSAKAISSHYDIPWALIAELQGNVAFAAEDKEKMLQILKDNQNAGGKEDDGTYGYEYNGVYYVDLDTTAIVVQALAPQYSKNSNAKAIADKAIDALSRKQDNTTGSLGNANTDAAAITALAAMGINPDSDSRFVKTGKSLVDGLLSYALADKTGFGYMNNTEKNALATEQGFRALIAAYRIAVSGNAYNVFDFSSNSTAAVSETTSGGSSGSQPSSGQTETDVNVTVSIKADTGYWLNNKTVAVKAGATVYQAFAKAIEGTGIKETGGADGYISSMSYDGKTLAQLGSGNNSGWLYKLNGELPTVGITSQKVSDKDTVLFYYTNDWTKDPDAGSVTGGGTGKTDDKKDEAKTEEALKAEETAAGQNGQAATTFSDVADSHWAKDAIGKVVAKGLFKGTTEKEFAPNANMTREQMWMVLARLAGNTEQNSDFVTPSSMQEAAVWAKEKGITDGSNPKGDVTREQFVTLMWRTLGSPASSYDLSKYADSSNISDWAKTAMAWAVETGLVSGTSATKLSPSATATRAQIATIFARYLDK